jgi:hypothetical protein
MMQEYRQKKEKNYEKNAGVERVLLAGTLYIA